MAYLGSLKLLGLVMALTALHTQSFAETPQLQAQSSVSDTTRVTQDEQPLSGDSLFTQSSQENAVQKTDRSIVASEVGVGPAENPAQAPKTPSPHSDDSSAPSLARADSEPSSEALDAKPTSTEPEPSQEETPLPIKESAEDREATNEPGSDPEISPADPSSTEVLEPALPSSVDPAIVHKFAGAAPEVLDLIKSGVLRVGMCTIDQPPFHVTGPDGTFTGFDIDLAYKLAEALGVKVVFVEAPDWDSTIQLVLDDKADIMLSNMTLLPERAAKLYCSKPYARIRQCMLLNRILLARAEGKGLTTLRQIFSQYDNRTLIIQKGAAYETSAGNMFPQAKVETTESWEEILQKILNREAFATISDEIEIKKQMRTVQSMELTAVTLKGMFDLMVIGVSRKLPQLLSFIDTFIEVEGIECNLDQVE